MDTVGDAYFDRDIGQYLKSCRLAAGWSQAQVAELLGVTFQQVQKYETGTNRLPASRYPKLAEAINFQPTALLLGSWTQDSTAAADVGELLTLIRSLNADKRRALMVYARFLVTS